MKSKAYEYTDKLKAPACTIHTLSADYLWSRGCTGKKMRPVNKQKMDGQKRYLLRSYACFRYESLYYTLSYLAQTIGSLYTNAWMLCGKQNKPASLNARMSLNSLGC